MMDFKQIKNGTISSPKGFKADGIFAGLKSPGEGKLDLGIILSDENCDWAATYTSNKIKSASIDYCQEINGRIRGIVVNSGSANCCVGDQGLIDARRIATLAQKQFDSQEPFLVSSTGMIGVEIPMGLIEKEMIKFKPSEDGGEKFSRAIITTDSKTKNICIEVESPKGKYKVGGVAKGSGMIHPKMGTMLSYITTDAKVNSATLTQVLRESVNNSFNQVDIDGDTSTNDTVVLMANGMANTEIAEESDKKLFLEAVEYVSKHLAKLVAEDGEGISHLITADVTGAKDNKDALAVSRAIISSSLVKTAVFGKDPNWGRIMMAIGNSEAEIERDKIRIYINGIQIAENGKSISFHYQSVLSALNNFSVDISVDLGIADGKGIAWGSDLTEEYVIFNSAYTT